jgi:hypothetical protein
MSNADSIETSRLHLELLCLEVLELLRAQKVEEASRVQGFEFTREFLASINEVFLTRQLDGLRKRPLTPGWFVRAIIRNADGSVIGHCGFHGAPDDIGRAEVGYIIYSPYRRCGYATESVEGLVEWGAVARIAQGVRHRRDEQHRVVGRDPQTWFYTVQRRGGEQQSRRVRLPTQSVRTRVINRSPRPAE